MASPAYRSTFWERVRDRVGDIISDMLIPGVGSMFFFVVALLINGWVIKVVWNWFVPSIFVSLHSLTFGQAMGLSMVMAVLFSSSSNHNEDTSFGYSITMSIVLNATLLITGFFVHLIWF